jgi:hypothetical protein
LKIQEKKRCVAAPLREDTRKHCVTAPLREDTRKKTLRHCAAA